MNRKILATVKIFENLNHIINHNNAIQIELKKGGIKFDKDTCIQSSFKDDTITFIQYAPEELLIDHTRYETYLT